MSNDDIEPREEHAPACPPESGCTLCYPKDDVIGVVASIVPIRDIPPKPKRHRWAMIGMNEWACTDCAQTRRRPAGDSYRYFTRDGIYAGHHAPRCDGVPYE